MNAEEEHFQEARYPTQNNEMQQQSQPIYSQQYQPTTSQKYQGHPADFRTINPSKDQNLPTAGQQQSNKFATQIEKQQPIKYQQTQKPTQTQPLTYISPPQNDFSQQKNYPSSSRVQTQK